MGSFAAELPDKFQFDNLEKEKPEHRFRCSGM